MVLDVLLGLEGGNVRNRVEPVEEAVEADKIVSSVVHTDGRDGGPSKKRGSGEWDAREEKALEGEYYGRVLDLNPLELERGPDADEEVGLGAEESEGDGRCREAEGGGEEEGDLGKEQGKPHGQEGAGL